jgi:hypothetical protein
MKKITTSHWDIPPEFGASAIRIISVVLITSKDSVYLAQNFVKIKGILGHKKIVWIRFNLSSQNLRWNFRIDVKYSKITLFLGSYIFVFRIPVLNTFVGKIKTMCLLNVSTSHPYN